MLALLWSTCGWVASAFLSGVTGSRSLAAYYTDEGAVHSVE